MYNCLKIFRRKQRRMPRPMFIQSFFPDVLYELFRFMDRRTLARLELISYMLHMLIKNNFPREPYLPIHLLWCSVL